MALEKGGLIMNAKRWKPAVLKAFAESDCLVNDLESGKVTREELIARGELKPFDEFLKKLHRKSGYVSCK